MSNAEKRLSSGSIIGISATVIALASLVLSVWDGCETRQHDRLSVMPQLTAIDAFAWSSPEFGILISNKGTGPAIVRAVSIFVDGKPIASKKYGGWKEAISQLGIDETWIHYHYFADGDAISVGEVITLLGISSKDQTDANRYQLMNVTPRLRVEIRYESIYGEQRTTTVEPEP